MSDKLKEELINIISLILNARGEKLTEEERMLLASEQFKQSNAEQKKGVAIISLKMLEGYLTLAIKGHQFTNIDKIKQRFGKSIEDNYPEASETFIKFAKSYWTLKVYLSNIFSEKLLNYTAYAALSYLEGWIGSIFFPTPGPYTIPSNEREKTQREILKEFDIDVEDFMKGNPILIRDRKAGI